MNTWGKQPNGDSWMVAITNPLNKEKAFSWLPIDNSAIVTSGNYEKFVVFDNIRYAHIIDPRTGYPAQGIVSASVLCSSAELADALATAVTVMGVEVGLDFINQLKQTHLITTLVSLLVLVLGIALMSHLATRIANPLKRLVNETEKIKKFDLSNAPPIQSRIKEVLYLSEAIHSMKKGLQSFQRYVPAALVRQLIETGNDAVIGGAKTKLAVLFTDINNFTSIVEKEKPAELMRLAMTRAKFAEGIATLHRQTDTAKAFLTGMMSLMDAILDEPMSSVLTKLPLAKDIKDALVGEPGLLSEYLALVKCYERAEWQESNSAMEKLKLDPKVIPDKYHEAVQWANEQMRALGDN